MSLVIGFMVVVGILALAAAQMLSANISVFRKAQDLQSALDVAQAGASYYTWHLEHAPTDLKDGQAIPAVADPNLGFGPYVHDYKDSSGKVLGQYTLWIRQKPSSSHIIIRSIGSVNGTTRTIEAETGQKAYSQYYRASGDGIYFGSEEDISGPMHSNGYVHIDGKDHGQLVESSLVTTTDCGPSTSAICCNTSNLTGIWACNTRNKSNWKVGVPTFDFTALTSSMCTMKVAAFADYAATSALALLGNACSQVPVTRTNAYIPRRGAGFSANQGYLIELNTAGTYNLYNVNQDQDATGTSYTTALAPGAAIQSNIPLPPTGVIFVEDNVWIRTNPTFHGRVSVVAARLADANDAAINIADALKYVNKDGTDVIGLISEGRTNIEPYVEPANIVTAFNFEIDANIIANKGLMFPWTYKQNGCVTSGWGGSNQLFHFYGSLASATDAGTGQHWFWGTTLWCGNSVWFDSASYHGYISGFIWTQHEYDTYAANDPPPKFPTTGQTYEMHWRELLPGSP
jgi:type II secretory pathway pseudopilin PulG